MKERREGGFRTGIYMPPSPAGKDDNNNRASHMTHTRGVFKVPFKSRVLLNGQGILHN